MTWKHLVFCTLLSTLLAPAGGFAAPRGMLADIYWARPDLHSSFEPERLRAIPGTNAGFLIDLEDWAEQYGWREHAELAEFKPQSEFIPEPNRIQAPLPEVTAENWLILDRSSRQILAAQNANREWPIASLTKLMTAEVVLDKDLPPAMRVAVRNTDNVGGARLYIEDGEEFTLDDLLYATLVGSANNAANAIARAAGYSPQGFVRAMNGRTDLLNLSRTRYEEPSGIELGNVSTAREMARIAEWVFRRPEIRRYTTTPNVDISPLTTGGTKRIKTTNWMLYYPEYEDVYVMSGKTGYLIESGWNVVESLRDDFRDPNRELLLVVFGGDSREDVFKDANALAHWAWGNYTWVANQ